MTMSKKKTKSPNKQKKQKTRMPRQLTAGFDEAAKSWARLLADPCNAPLAHACYPTTAGGMLQRYEFDFLVSTSGTSTAGGLIFTPGSPSTVGTSSVGAVQYIDAASDGIGVPWSVANGSQPGVLNFGTMSGVRAVAACAQIMWPGSELTRSGIVGLGVVPSGITQPNPGQVPSVANLRTLCPFVTRMPNATAEIKWRPGEKDSMFVDPNSTQTNEVYNGHNSLLLCYSGFPVSTGVRIRLVVVYEVQYAIGYSTIASLVSPPEPVSKFSINEIFSAMDKAGNWMYELASGPVGKIAYDLGSNLVKRAPNVLALMA